MDAALINWGNARQGEKNLVFFYDGMDATIKKLINCFTISLNSVKMMLIAVVLFGL